MIEPYSGRTPRVLIVEDVAMNRELIRSVFDETYEFIDAPTGEEGIEAARNDVDLVLLDLTLPGISGIEVLEKLSRSPETTHIPVIVITGSPEERHRCLELGAFDFTTKPIDMLDLRLRARNALRLKFQYEQLKSLGQQEQGAGCMIRIEDALSERLGRFAEFRDLYESRHSSRVGLTAELLAEKLDLSVDERTLIRRAAPLHDIGKVGIPEAVLLKPEPLPEDEFAIMKLHVDIGRSLIGDPEGFPLLEAASIIISEHHERWDGTGYPAGKKGKDIHLYGRIVGLADAFDSMLSPRVYRDALPVDRVLENVKDGRGTLFDPRLVDILVSNLDEFLAIRREHESDNGDRQDLILKINEMMLMLGSR